MIKEDYYGLIFIVIGVLGLWYTIRYPHDKTDVGTRNVKGYIGGIGFILIGILLLVGYFKK